MRHRTLSILLALFVVTAAFVVFMTEEAVAHRQGLRPGYERMLYDCSHDYGWESGMSNDRGHDLNTLDIMEGTVDGVPVVFIEITLIQETRQGHVNGPMKETVRFESPRRSIETTINTTDERETPMIEDGLHPLRVLEPRHGLDHWGDVHEASIAYNLVYTYEQLQVRGGEVLTGFEVQGYYFQDGQWKKGDYMAGGRAWPDGTETENCKNERSPHNDDTFYVSSGYLVQHSNWVPDAPGDNVLPVADFNHDPSRPDPGEAVTFTDLSHDPDGHVVAWQWDFGDGTTSTDQHPVHTFDEPGRYVVTLRVTDDRGAFAQLGREIRVGDPPPPPGQGDASPEPPVAGFDLHPRQPVVGEEVTFVDGSFDPDGHIVAWEWSFGDGATATDYLVTHRYEEPGRYEVSLKVTDNDGLSASISKDLFILSEDEEATGPARPLAGFAYHPTNPDRVQDVSFTDTSQPGGAEIVSWSWRFGDEGTSTQRHPTHRFENTGLHHVRLEVEDANGQTAFVRQELIVVNLPPVASFEAEPSTPRPGETIRLVDRSVDPDGSIVAWDWFLGDGRSRYGANPEVVFEHAGTYDVVLTVTDDLGATDTRILRLTVSDPNKDPNTSTQEHAATGTTGSPTGTTNVQDTASTMTGDEHAESPAAAAWALLAALAIMAVRMRNQRHGRS